MRAWLCAACRLAKRPVQAGGNRKLAGKVVGSVFDPALKSRSLADFGIPARDIGQRRTFDVVELPTMRMDAERDITHAEVFAGDEARSPELRVGNSEGRDQFIVGSVRDRAARWAGGRAA
jgi:hypothetical protein